MYIFEYKLAGKKAEPLVIGEPNVRECDGILNPVSRMELIDYIVGYLSKNQKGISIKDKLIPADIILVQIKLKEWLRKIKSVPAYQSLRIEHDTDSEPLPYNCSTIHIKAVAEYARMSFVEVYALPITEFWKLFRDAVIWNYSRTEDGIDKLIHAKNMAKTKPDREGLHQEDSIVRRRRSGK